MTAVGPDPLLSLEVVTTPPAPVDLEVVRFDVQGPQSILPVSPSLRNVTVIRGSREALPLCKENGLIRPLFVILVIV